MVTLAEAGAYGQQTFFATRQTWASRDMSPSDKYTMLCLVGFADRFGGSIRPSLETVAKMTGRHVRTIQRAVGRLLRLGALVLTSDRRGGRNRPATYALGPLLRKGDTAEAEDRDRLDLLKESPPAERVTNGTGKGDTGVTRSGTATPDPSIRGGWWRWRKGDTRPRPTAGGVLGLAGMSWRAGCDALGHGGECQSPALCALRAAREGKTA